MHPAPHAHPHVVQRKARNVSSSGSDSRRHNGEAFQPADGKSRCTDYFSRRWFPPAAGKITMKARKCGQYTLQPKSVPGSHRRYKGRITKTISPLMRGNAAGSRQRKSGCTRQDRAQLTFFELPWPILAVRFATSLKIPVDACSSKTFQLKLDIIPLPMMVFVLWSKAAGAAI